MCIRYSVKRVNKVRSNCWFNKRKINKSFEANQNEVLQHIYNLKALTDHSDLDPWWGFSLSQLSTYYQHISNIGMHQPAGDLDFILSDGDYAWFTNLQSVLNELNRPQIRFKRTIMQNRWLAKPKNRLRKPICTSMPHYINCNRSHTNDLNRIDQSRSNQPYQQEYRSFYVLVSLSDDAA